MAYPDIYLFHESTNIGIYFSIPSSWHILYGIEETEFENERGIIRTVKVYHIATREEFGLDNGELFAISRFPNSLANGQVGIILAQEGGYSYAIGYPQDSIHAYDSDSVVSVQFRRMNNYLYHRDNNFITNSVRLLNAI